MFTLNQANHRKASKGVRYSKLCRVLLAKTVRRVNISVAGGGIAASLSEFYSYRLINRFNNIYVYLETVTQPRKYYSTT
jgi:hypothetical protein